jgi:hypothetical protein
VFTARYGLSLHTQNRLPFVLNNRAMAQAVSRRPLIVDAQVRHLASPREICVVQSGNGTRFSPSPSVPSVSIVPPKTPHSSSSQYC